MTEEEIQIIKKLDASIGELCMEFTNYSAMSKPPSITFAELIQTDEWKTVAKSIASIINRIELLKSINKIYDSKEELEDLIFSLQAQLTKFDVQ